MILRNCQQRERQSLERVMTVKEFIERIIENDNDKYLKFYSIILAGDLSARNMILYYQDGILKSHHSSFAKLDYADYLDTTIERNYEAGYITVDNIWDMNSDYKENTDFNKSNKKIENNEEREKREARRRKLGQIIDEKSKITSKFSFIRDIDKISKYDLCECMEQVLFRLNNLEEELLKRREMEKLQCNQIKWLEYKIDLLSKDKKEL